MNSRRASSVASSRRGSLQDLVNSPERLRAFLLHGETDSVIDLAPTPLQRNYAPAPRSSTPIIRRSQSLQSVYQKIEPQDYYTPIQRVQIQQDRVRELKKLGQFDPRLSEEVKKKRTEWELKQAKAEEEYVRRARQQHIRLKKECEALTNGKYKSKPKVYERSHSGSWMTNIPGSPPCWSCCLSASYHSKGCCVVGIRDPQKWIMERDLDYEYKFN